MERKNKKCLIVGSGPAALMAAMIVAEAGFPVEIFEKRKGPGRKLLIAGSSGLNVSYEAGPDSFPAFYRARKEELSSCLSRFGKDEWLEFIHALGIETFLGTSRRYFVKGMKASPLLRAWLAKLEGKGAVFHFEKELVDFSAAENGFVLDFRDGTKACGDVLLLALGGGSHEAGYPEWTKFIAAKGIRVEPLLPANAGFHIRAPESFFREAEGLAIKGVVLKTARGEKIGELMITRYGLEGTPIYSVGCKGAAELDLKPDLAEEKLRARLEEAGGMVLKRVEKAAKLSPGALLLAKHLAPPDSWQSIESAARLLKHFPLELLEPRPLEEAISSSGGVSWDELSEYLEAKKIPALFFAGEMVDWDGPTGGFLLTACASTAHSAAQGILRRLRG